MCGRPRVCAEKHSTPKCFACADQDTRFKYFGVLIVRSEDVSGRFLILSLATGQPEHGSACAGDGEKIAPGGSPAASQDLKVFGEGLPPTRTPTRMASAAVDGLIDAAMRSSSGVVALRLHQPRIQ